MVTASQSQRTYWIAAAEDTLNQQVDVFLLDRQIQGLGSVTFRFYCQKLVLFQNFC